MALLAVAAVVVVLGGSVVGIQLVSSGPAGSTTGCQTSGCVAGASNQPAPEDTLADPDEEPSSSEEPSPAEEPAAEEKPDPDASGTPAPVTTPRRVSRTQGAKPRPTPTATNTPRRTQQPQPQPEEPQPTPSSVDQSPISDTPTHRPSESSGVTEPSPAPTSSATSTAPAAGAAVTVGYGLVSEKGKAYTAQLVVTADDRLDRLTLKVPVSGEVTSVRGANWSQTGETLVIESTERLDEGENLVVTFTADGQAHEPRTCQSSQGDCVVV
ncbi:hypothetical protein [Streptosporangium carneum]|nr:hypothetical protein [Streptosporangium carneum]